MKHFLYNAADIKASELPNSGQSGWDTSHGQTFYSLSSSISFILYLHTLAANIHKFVITVFAGKGRTMSCPQMYRRRIHKPAVVSFFICSISSVFSNEIGKDEEEASEVLSLITSMRKSPVLRPALQATPSTSTDSRY